MVVCACRVCVCVCACDLFMKTCTLFMVCVQWSPRGFFLTSFCLLVTIFGSKFTPKMKFSQSRGDTLGKV